MSEVWLSIEGHLQALRQVLLSSLILILLGTICAFCFYREIFDLLQWPLQPTDPFLKEQIQRERISNPTSSTLSFALPAHAKLLQMSPGVTEVAPRHFLIPAKEGLEMETVVPVENRLVVLSPLEGFLAALKVSAWMGIVGTSPLWMALWLRFLLPGLQMQEKRMVAPFLGISLLFVVMGLIFAFFVTIPMANQYLQIWNAEIGVNLWSLSEYLDYTIVLLLSNAFAFECAAILLFLVHIGVLDGTMLRSKRRHAIVLAFVIGAILTPPDVLTQCLLALPLLGLYELIIVYARLIQDRQDKQEKKREREREKITG